MKRSPEKGLSFEEAVAICQKSQHGGAVIGNGYFIFEGFGQDDYMETMEKGIGNETQACSFAAHVAEVEVHKETEKVKVVNMACSHDCRCAINPMGLIGATT